MARDGVQVWLVLGAVVSLGACRENNGARPPNAGTGGAGSPSIGTSVDAAPGDDGAAPGAEGFGGHGDGIPSCAAADTSPAPSTGLIADFVTTGGAGIEIGGIIRASGVGDATPTASTTGGILHIVETAPVLNLAPVSQVFLLFDRCIDATGFAGLQFSISGTASPCTILYAPMDSGHIDSRTLGGGGPVNAQLLSVELAPAQFGPMVKIPFAGPGAPTNGVPDTPVDRAKVVGMEWVLMPPRTLLPDGAPACTADLSIDNIAFYR